MQIDDPYLPLINLVVCSSNLHDSALPDDQSVRIMEEPALLYEEKRATGLLMVPHVEEMKTGKRQNGVKR